MLNRHFKPVTNPSQSLLVGLIGETELGLCEFIEIRPACAGEDECYRVSTTRCFQIESQRGNFCELQEWYVDEFIGFALLGCNGDEQEFEPAFEPHFDPYYDPRN